MIIKQPACYDGSHYWSSVPDFKLIDPRPAVMIFKASEAFPPYGIEDNKFVDYFSRSLEIGCIRGAYHFFRRAYNPIKQAEYYLSIISKVDILPTDILILDVEEGKETASQLWAFFETVKKKYPDNLLMIYSRKNILDPIVMTYAEKEYFKNIPTWTAGYPIFPDLFSSVPNSKLFSYTPDQTKFGPVYFWQYSSVGIIKGINGSVDLNWINPLYSPLLGTNETRGAMDGFWQGKALEPAKLWKTIGGERIYYNGTDLKKDTPVEIDWDGTVSGVKYVRLTSPIDAYSKAEWFSYYPVDVDPDPETPPPTIVKVPFTLNIQGYKTYTGELEKL